MIPPFSGENDKVAVISTDLLMLIFDPSVLFFLYIYDNCFLISDIGSFPVH